MSAPTSPAQGSPLERMVILLCGGCGRRKRTPRTEYDPPETARIEYNYCDKCDAGGGFEHTTHYDASGAEITAKRVSEWLGGLAEKYNESSSAAALGGKGQP